MVEEAKQVFTSILEPFDLEKMYPAIDVETSPGSGIWKEIHSIQEHQRKLHDKITPSGKKANRILFSGGVGNGKSHCMSVEMFRLLRTYPRIKVACVTAYDYFIDESILPTWYKILPEDSPHIKRYNRKQRIITLTNGSSIRFKAYDDPDKIRGWDAHVIWIEEAAELGDANNDKAMAIWQNLCMRLRANRPRYPLLMYVSQNPKGHNWVWKVFIRNEPGVAEQPLADKGMKTVVGYTQDNPPLERYFKEWEKVHANGDVFYTIAANTSSNAFVPAGYVSSMLGQMADNPAIRQRMVDGEFNPINTLVYDAPLYSERTHCIDFYRFLEYWDVDEVPSWWRVVVGIDCAGQRSPWAVEFYVETPDGHWVCFDEIYQVGLTWGEIAELILDKSEGFTNIQYWIDPISSQHKSGPNAQNITDEFTRRGIGVQQPRHYSKVSGVMRVQSYLKRDHNQPCPYMDDPQIDDGKGNLSYEFGLSQLYYLTNVPYKFCDTNIKGHAAPANLAEKGVFRIDNSKVRPTKEHEEGLSPVVSEKFMDRDDHTITAEIFAFLGIAPLQMPPASRAARNRIPTEPGTPPMMYGRRAKRRGF